MQLTLSKSTIRSFRPNDADSITRHIGTYSVARNMLRIPHPYAMQDAEQWIGIATKQDPQTNFAIAIDDQIVGGIGLEVNPSGAAACKHSAEIGYWLGETFWGRGIATEALTAMSEWAFRELNLVRLHAMVFARNNASARVLEKAGYAFEGRLLAHYFRDGEFIDGLLYAKVRLPQ
jgi:ribosomal-protein-alanine N-acetyltransferase